MKYNQIITMYVKRATDEIINYIAGTAQRQYTFKGRTVIVENIDKWLEAVENGVEPDMNEIKIKVVGQDGNTWSFIEVFTLFDFFILADEINSKRSVEDPERDSIGHEYDFIMRHADEVVRNEILERKAPIFLNSINASLALGEDGKLVVRGAAGDMSVRQVFTDDEHYIKAYVDHIKSIGDYLIRREDIEPDVKETLQRFVGAGMFDKMTPFIFIITNQRDYLDGTKEDVIQFLDAATPEQLKLLAGYLRVNNPE